MKGERTVEKRRERNTKKTLLDIYSKYGIILILILIMAFLTIRTGGTFIGKNNLLNILKQIACIGVLACGQTAVIIAGGMDLSVGSIVSLVSVLVASTAHPGDFPLIVPIMVGLLTGLVCGLINGVLVGRGAFGNPFLFSKRIFSPEERLAVIERHLDLTLALRGERVGVPLMRKHLCAYIKGFRGGAKARPQILSANTREEILAPVRRVMLAPFDKEER